MLHRLSAVLVVSLTTLSVWTTACNRAADTKGFTEAEIAGVQETLKGVDPGHYRIVLPELSDGKIIGSKTYGSLAITEVKRLASLKGITYADNGNLQAILADDGGGAGSHTESQSAGTDIGNRIDKILANLDKSSYVLIR